MQSEFISVSSEPVGGEGAVEEKNPKAILYDNISRKPELGFSTSSVKRMAGSSHLVSRYSILDVLLMSHKSSPNVEMAIAYLLI